MYSLKSKDEILHDYKGIFEGVGKLTGLQVKLNVDPEVPAVAQPVRRTPFSLREKVKEKIEGLVAMDIIEPVEGPTPWVSPVVVVPKQNDEIRVHSPSRLKMNGFCLEASEETQVSLLSFDTSSLDGLEGFRIINSTLIKWTKGKREACCWKRCHHLSCLQASFSFSYIRCTYSPAFGFFHAQQNF